MREKIPREQTSEQDKGERKEYFCNQLLEGTGSIAGFRFRFGADHANVSTLPLSNLGNGLVRNLHAPRRRLVLSTGFGQLTPATVLNSNPSQPFDSPVDPAEASLFVRQRIENPRDLPRGGEEILVNEGVVLGEKDPESRVRMIPAHNPLIGERPILYRVDVLPGILRKCNVGPRLVGIFPFDAGRDLDALIFILSDQHPTDFSGARGTRVLPDFAHDFAIH